MLRRLSLLRKNVDTTAEVGLPPNLYRVWAIVVGLSFVSALFCVVTYRMHLSPVYYRVLSPPAERFSDFTIYQQKFQLYFHSASFFDQMFPFTYPAPVALVYDFFFREVSAPVKTFVVFSVLAMVIPAGLFGFALRRRGVSSSAAFLFAGTLLVLSWPAILVIDRGNMEVLVWITLATATWAFAKGRSSLAAVFFGLATALKLFPFVFLALFLSTRRWKELFTGVVVFMIVSILSLVFVGPSLYVAARGIGAGLRYFEDTYMLLWRSSESGVDHSLFALVKLALIGLVHHRGLTPFSRSLSLYMASTAVFGTALYFLRIRFLPLLNQLLLLSIASIYFTAFSGDGTLLHLYYAFALLILLAIDAWRKKIQIAGLGTALCLLACLQSYESFLVFYAHRLEGEVKCVLLGWLFVLALQFPFGPPLDSPGGCQPLLSPDASRVVGAQRLRAV